MRQHLAYLAIAALAASWCVPAASAEDTERVPARVNCSKDGRPVAIELIVPRPGLVTLTLPPDICAQAKPPKAPVQRPGPPAPASPSTANMI